MRMLQGDMDVFLDTPGWLDQLDVVGWKCCQWRVGPESRLRCERSQSSNRMRLVGWCMANSAADGPSHPGIFVSLMIERQCLRDVVPMPKRRLIESRTSKLTLSLPPGKFGT